MPLLSPNLDDRDFHDLVEEAQRLVVRSCPGWTDLSAGDPGMVLLELFAHLTETMIYRLNRLPEKAYVEFLRLMGVTLQPPAAARVTLVFRRSRASEQPVEVPQNTRVTLARAAAGKEPPVFATGHAATIAPGHSQVEVVAHHADWVEAELAAVGTGLPGLSLVARRPPIIAPTGDGSDLVVGVEAERGERNDRVPARLWNGKTFRIWREAEHFANAGADSPVYLCDRATGTITFAPAVRALQADGTLEATPQALAAVPGAGREIRLWYRCGGGPDGNVAANTLATLKDPIPGLEVSNPAPATGGRAAETLQNALVRGPQELHSLRRAVTARDFELIAQNETGAVARAKAFTTAALWKHAPAGTVEVLLVPFVPDDQRGGGRVSAAVLKEQETEEVRTRLQALLDQRRPLGTSCRVQWVRYKTVQLRARVVVHRGENAEAVRARVEERLHQAINPLPTSVAPSGWRFGQPLRASHVYDILLAEPGVSYVDQVRFTVEEVPETEVVALAADAFQPKTWHAATGETLFRSGNDGDGWEPAGRWAGEAVDLVRVHAGRPGLLAVATRSPGGANGSRLHVSSDCGETWQSVAQTAFTVEDMAWIDRDRVAVLLLVTDVGLYELAMQPGASPVQILVDPADQDLGFYAIAAATDVRGTVAIAVAARATGGVYLSKQGGRPGTFEPKGLKGEDVHVLTIQQDGPRAFLWAGVFSPGNETGKGCFRWELRGLEDPPEGWQAFHQGWTGGSCRSLAFHGPNVLAATHRAGVLRLDLGAADAAWQAPPVGCGLPIRDKERIFHPVNAVAVDGDSRWILAGGPQGVYRSGDGGLHYEPSSARTFSERVTLPDTWLFCSGAHQITAVDEHDANRD